MPRPRLSLIALGWLWPDSGPHVRLRHFCGRRGRFLAAGGPGKAIGPIGAQSGRGGRGGRKKCHNRAWPGLGAAPMLGPAQGEV